MTWRAAVEDDWMADGVKIHLARLGEAEGYYLDFQNVLIHTYQRNEGVTMGDPPTPLRLKEDAARALLDALLSHFRMTRADENLRVDYLAERARVDKLIDAQIAVRGRR